MFNHTGEYQHYFGLTGTPDFLQALADFYTRSVEDDIISISVKGLKMTLDGCTEFVQSYFLLFVLCNFKEVESLPQTQIFKFLYLYNRRKVGVFTTYIGTNLLCFKLVLFDLIEFIV